MDDLLFLLFFATDTRYGKIIKPASCKNTGSLSLESVESSRQLLCTAFLDRVFRAKWASYLE